MNREAADIHVGIVNPWAGGSHLAWQHALVGRGRHRYTTFTLPPTAWRWRMHGASVTLAGLVRAVDEPLDVVVATDMIDLSNLVALARDRLAGTPVVLYLHEDQLTYPRRPGEALDRGLAWITWKNLLVADEVWCNSAFHRDALVAALDPLLASVPDADHRHLLDAVVAKLRVMPVPVDLSWVGAGREAGPSSEPLVAVNHRWHHDKDVGAIVRALRRLAGEGIAFRVAVIGDHRGGEAAVIDPVLDELGARVVARGLQPVDAYRDWLRRADVVVSAARNECFGVAVVEAIAAGCVPVLPRALAYPEVVPEPFHDACLYRPGDLTGALRRVLTALPAARRATAGLADSMRRFDGPTTAAYDEAFARLTSGRAPVDPR